MFIQNCCSWLFGNEQSLDSSIKSSLLVSNRSKRGNISTVVSKTNMPAEPQKLPLKVRSLQERRKSEIAIDQKPNSIDCNGVYDIPDDKKQEIYKNFMTEKMKRNSFKKKDHLDKESIVHKMQKLSSVEKSSKTSRIKVEKQLESLSDVLKQNQIYKDLLTKCLIETDKYCCQLNEILSPGKENELKSFLFSNAEHQECEKYLQREPMIMVIGQINCGKTTLINEILGKQILPTSELPCTARVVQVKYSPEPYVALYDNKNILINKFELVKKRKILRDIINLNEVDREDSSKVGNLVEVGLDNELLQRGLQIVDAPGLSENDILNRQIELLSKQDLQLMIYVIDGNTSLTEKDRAFLYTVKKNAPKMKIIYVCNKVEEDPYAQSMDLASDDEQEQRDKHTVDKGTWTFGNLQKFGLISKSDNIHDCEEYFALSCLNVHKARRKKIANQYTENFDCFLNIVAKNYMNTAVLQLEQAVKRLNLIQKRAFDFCISDRFINLSKPKILKEKIQQSREAELRIYQSMLDTMRADTRSTVAILRKSLDTRGQKIMRKIAELSFNPVYIQQGVAKNFLIENCRQQIYDFVLVQLNKDIEQHLQEEWDRFMMTIQTYIDDLIESFHPFQDYVREHMKFAFNSVSNFRFESLDLNQVLDAKILSAGKKATTRYENVKAAIVGWQLNDEWKLQNAKILLESIDIDVLVGQTQDKMKRALINGHIEFQNCLNIFDYLLGSRIQSVPKMQQDLLQLMPHFGLIICKTDALLNVQYHTKDISKCAVIGEGSRSTVYTMEKFNDVVFKKTRDDTDFATIYNFLRLVKHENLLKQIGTTFDDNLNLLLVLPRVRFHTSSPDARTLFDLLVARERFNQYEILYIFYQLVKVTHDMAEKKFRLTDLRPNNIFIVKEAEGSYCVKVNIKQRVLDVPYPQPDGLKPFHFAPEIYDSKLADSGVTAHDVYSVGVLLWMMLQGQFVRPTCVQGRYGESVKTVAEKVTTKILQGEMLMSLRKLHQSKQMHGVIQSCLDISPSNRPNFNTLLQWCKEGLAKLSE